MLNKKKIIILVVLLLAIIISSVRIFNKSTSRQQNIKIGVLLPLTTDFAWWGEAIHNSVSIAQVHGYMKDAEFIYEDTKCNTKDAVSGTLSLKARYPDMHMFIVGCDSDLKAMVPILDKEKDIAFIVGLSSADLYEQNFPIINLAYRLETEGGLAAEFAHKKLGARSLGIIVDNGNFGGVLGNSATEYMLNNSRTSTTERLKYNDPNPETSILKIIQTNPDAVYIQNDIPTISRILIRLDQLNYTGKRFVYYGGRDQSLIDTAGKSAEGVYVPWPISDISNPMRVKFTDTFKAMYSKDPFITAYFVYDGIVLLDEAEKHCDNNIRCIVDYFYKKDDFSGTLGKVQYQTNGEIKRDFYFQQIKDGKFVEVK